MEVASIMNAVVYVLCDIHNCWFLLLWYFSPKMRLLQQKCVELTVSQFTKNRILCNNVPVFEWLSEWFLYPNAGLKHCFIHHLDLNVLKPGNFWLFALHQLFYAASQYYIRSCSMVCHSVCHTSEPCRNGSSDRDAVWVEDSGGPKEPCIRWGSRC